MVELLPKSTSNPSPSVVWDQSYYVSNYFEVDQGQLSTGVMINNNTVSNVDGDGIISFGSLNPEISHNVVSNASQRSILGSSEASSVGIMVTRDIGALVEFNEVYGTKTQTTDGEGFDVDLGSSSTTLEYNYSHDNQGGFLLMMGGASDNLIVRFNLSVNDGFSGVKGVFTFDSNQTNTSIYNNTIYTPIGSPANLVGCQNCGTGSGSIWSFQNNLVDNQGTGSFQYPSQSQVHFSSNDFFGITMPNQPNDPTETALDPHFVSAGSDLAGSSGEKAYMVVPGSQVLVSGTPIVSSGNQDFFGDPLPASSGFPIGFYSPGTPQGYWLLTSQGLLYSYGGAGDYGCACGNAAISIAVTPDSSGYWILDTSSQVHGFGQVPQISTQVQSSSPLVAIASTCDGLGFWLASSSGQVFPQGDAVSYGDLVSLGLTLNAQIKSIVPTKDCLGYWLVGADGGVFAFGDAQFFGSTGNLHLVSPVVAMARSSDSKGYWLVGADGGVFAFGDAGFYGSIYQIDPGRPPGPGNSVAPLRGPIVAVSSTGDSRGYWLIGSDGGVFAFGDAGFLGSLGQGSQSVQQDPIIAFAPFG